MVIVPDVLGGPPEAAEPFISIVASSKPRRQVTLALSNVTWICPYGSALLLCACRYLAKMTDHPVELKSLRSNVHAYLRRVDFFDRAGETAFTKDQFDEIGDLGRSPASTNVLELVPVAKPDDVYDVSARARRILRYWLRGTPKDIDQIVSLLSEACSNVVDHSHDVGAVAIQKYEREPFADVELAISDLGIGIRRSLVEAHGEVSQSASGYIEQALAGLSARHGRGGHGLGAIILVYKTDP